VTKLTKAQRANLDKLATYLEGLPEDYAHFEMSDYIVGGEKEDVARYALENGGVNACGAVACAIGHGPAAGVLVNPKDIERDRYGVYVDWEGYARTNFGCRTDTTRRNWWMFAGDWSGVDNHPHGAAARIRYILAHGKPPGGFTGDANSALLPLYAPYRIDAKAKADA
jgi:hypothetical protein